MPLGGKNVTDVTGSATYAGHAAGKFAISDPIGEADAGHFTADVALTASFDGAARGVSGMIDNFMANEEAVDWSVRLRSASWDATQGDNPGEFATPADDPATVGVDESKGTIWSITSKAAPSATGNWGGTMYDENGAADSSDVPTSTTGTFQSHYGETHTMVGAFGATRQ